MFDDDFFAAVGLAGLSDDDKNELGMQLAELVQERLAVRLGDTLTEEQAEQFDKLADEDDVKAFEYLEQVYPQYAEAMAEEIERAKGELLHDMQIAQEHLRERE